MTRAFVLVLALTATAAGQSTPPVRVDRYGQPLPAGARERLGSLAFRQTGSSAQTLRFSPRGDLLVSHGYGPRLTLWDPVRGRRLGQLVGTGTSGWNRVAFSPDGQLLVGAGESDGSVEVWDVKTRRRLRRLTQRIKSSVTGLFFTKRRELLVTTMDELRWWDLTTGKSLRMVVTECLLHGARLSADGAWIVVHDTDGRVKLLDTTRGDVAREIGAFDSRAHVYDHVLGPKLRWVAAVGGRSKARALRLFDAKTGKRRWSQPTTATDVWLAPDGKHLITIEDFAALQVWDLKGNKTVRVPVPHTSTLGISGTKSLLALNAGAALATLSWPPKAGQQPRRPKGHASFSDLVVSPDGKRVFSTGGGELRAWSLSDGAELRAKAFPRAGDLAISPDGRWLAVEQVARIAAFGVKRKPAAAVIFDAKTWKERARFALRGWMYRDLRFSPDGKLLAVGGRSGVRLIDTATWAEQKPLPGGNWTLAFAPQGETLAVGGGKTIRLFGISTRRVEQELKHPQVFGLAYSPDGKRLAFSSLSPRALEILDVGSGKRIHDLKALFNMNGAPKPVFSPDGKTLVFGFSDKAEQISLVDVRSGKVRQTLATPGEGYADTVAFSPDGKTLVSGHRSGTILVWSLSGAPPARAKGLESPFRD